MKCVCVRVRFNRTRCAGIGPMTTSISILVLYINTEYTVALFIEHVLYAMSFAIHLFAVVDEPAIHFYCTVMGGDPMILHSSPALPLYGLYPSAICLEYMNKKAYRCSFIIIFIIHTTFGLSKDSVFPAI